VHRDGSILLVNGEFKFLLGVNYWPRKLNIKMWREWSEEAIREDAALMRDLGIRAVRVFLLCEDFADTTPDVHSEAIAKLRRLLDILHEHGLVAFITLIVGHMSGKNWSIPWTRFNDLYEHSSVERTMRFIENIIREVRDHPAVAGYILSNELSLVKRAESRDEALRLLRAFSETVRSIDKNHVISSGDTPDSYLQETPNIRELVDYAGPHLYIYDTDLTRHGYIYGALVELYSNTGDLPVILEEFGFSTHQYSEESQARFISETLYTALAHGASGAFVWCFSDFTSETDPPYEWRPLELGFGVIRGNGSLKPAALVIKRFANELERLEEIGFNRAFKRKPEVSVVVPFYVFRDYEFVWYKSTLGFWEAVKAPLVASTLLSSSSVDNTLIFELDVERLFKRVKLLVMPSIILALTTTWRKLLGFIEEGGVLYVSLVKEYGAIRARHETATHMWCELMGVENTLRAGSIGAKYHGRVTVEFTKSLNLIESGVKITIETQKPLYTYELKPVDAEVLAVDSSNRPVLFRAKRGRGYVYVNTIPLELIESSAEYMDWSGRLQLLYKSVAREAGVNAPYEASSPEVEVKTFRGRSGDLVVVVNHGDYKRVTITSTNIIKNLNKLGGDAEIVSWRGNNIELNMPLKASIILHVEA
jgi:endo-1,4-beta-mannosidase